ncbi:MAG: hypothetical protein Fur0046_23130 [Cyanobacteria bacterium J069]|nr:MAG: hypothetical protein D6742_14345 [Cyanobacteria bacterium J069]
MTPQLMIQPSSFLPTGIHLQPVGNFSLFRFTDDLQTRLETLLEKQKTDSLSDAEAAEWAGITDLSRTFTFINAQLAAQAKWSPAKLEDWYSNEPDTAANIATPPNI